MISCTEFIPAYSEGFKYFEQIDRFAPSSQICYQCGNKQEMPLKERTYNCNSCGHIMDRDLNASKNILRIGMDSLRNIKVPIEAPTPLG